MPSLLVLILVLLVTLGQIAVDIYLPSLPTIANHFHASELLTETTLTAYLFGFGFSQLIYGPLSDYYGRKKILVFGITVFLLAALGCALSPTIYILIAMRFAQGLGAGACAVLSRAIVRDVFDGPRLAKIISQLTLTWSLVPIVAPLLGSYIQHYSSWRISFLSLFVYASFIAVLIMQFLPNTNQDFLHSEFNFRKIIKNYTAIIFNKLFFSAALCSSLCYTIIISYAATSPFLIQTQLGFSPVLYGWITLISASAYLLGNYANSHCVTRFGIKKMITVGYFFLFTGSCLSLIFSLMGLFNIWVLVVPIYIIFIGTGFISPNCITEALAPFRHAAGTAGASLGFLQMLSCGAVNTLISKFYPATQLSLAVLFIVMTAILGYIFLSFRPSLGAGKLLPQGIRT